MEGDVYVDDGICMDGESMEQNREHANVRD